MPLDMVVDGKVHDHLLYHSINPNYKIDLIKFLIQSNADVNGVQTTYHTEESCFTKCLSFSYSTSNTEIVELFLKANCSLWVTSDVPPRHFLENIVKHPKVLHLLLKYKKLDEIQGRVIHLACQLQVYESVVLLLSTGVNPNMMMNDTTLLHTATKAKNKPLIQLLIAFGASKDIESGKPGKKQSLYSATEGDPDIIHCLNHPSFSVDRAIYKMLPQEIREAIFTWLVILKRYVENK
uniref:Uncharacterized protein n=1 Tax=Arcella intermedia TaxID=1963864 RepID=A0A6B2LF87_9EUKA